MSESGKEITIIGSGIVGVMACLYLQMDGWQVTLIDRFQPGDSGQTSWGNAGSISIGNVTPLGKPGILLDSASMLISKNSPLSMPVDYLHHSLPWLLKVLKTSGKNASTNIAKEICALNNVSGSAWRELIEKLGLSEFIAPNGWLKLYEKKASFEKTVTERKIMSDAGMDYEVLGEKEIQEHEPALAPIFSRAILQKGSLGINSPGKLMQRLAEIAKKKGAVFLNKEVASIRKRENGFELHVEGEVYTANKILVAAGAWSARLAKQLGHNIPLEAERGYHVFFDENIKLKGPSINMDRYVAMSSMEGGVRVTSCVELAGLEKAPNYNKIQHLSKFANKALPDLKKAGAKEWMGYRPSLPDSKPVIGKSDTCAGLFFAFGHGHLGMTQGAGTGKLISELIRNVPTTIPLSPFAASRF